MKTLQCKTLFSSLFFYDQFVFQITEFSVSNYYFPHQHFITAKLFLAGIWRFIIFHVFTVLCFIKIRIMFMSAFSWHCICQLYVVDNVNNILRPFGEGNFFFVVRAVERIISGLSVGKIIISLSFRVVTSKYK